MSDQNDPAATFAALAARLDQLEKGSPTSAPAPAAPAAQPAAAPTIDIATIVREAVTAAMTASRPAPVPVAPAGPPISDKGSPGPGFTATWEAELAENPVGMSTAARRMMDAKFGAEKARKMRLEAAQSQVERIRVTRPGG